MASKPRRTSRQEEPPENQEPSPIPTPTTESTMSQSLTVQGLQFTVPKPFAEGHVCSAAEASALNQTFAENIRNNVAGKIRAKLEAANKDKPAEEHITAAGLDLNELAAMVAEYANSYSFAQRTARAPVDPVAHEAHKIAKSKLLEAMRAKNIDPKSLSAERMEANIQALIAKYPAITEEAQRRVAASRDIAGMVLDL